MTELRENVLSRSHQATKPATLRESESSSDWESTPSKRQSAKTRRYFQCRC